MLVLLPAPGPPAPRRFPPLRPCRPLPSDRQVPRARTFLLHRCPRISRPPSSSPLHHLLVDTQGVPYTVLVDEESQRESGPMGRRPRKKCYSCPVCSRVFEYMLYLQRHSITHSEVKPFECDTCGEGIQASQPSGAPPLHSPGRSAGGPGCRSALVEVREAGELADTARSTPGAPLPVPAPASSRAKTRCRSMARWKHPEPGWEAPRYRGILRGRGTGTPLVLRQLASTRGPGHKQTYPPQRGRPQP